MSRMMLRAIAVLALLGATVATSTGCVTFGACPAIGYVSAVTVDVSAYPGVADVQFCAEGECSRAPGEEGASSGNMYMATLQDNGTWSLAFGMDVADFVEIRLFDAQGTLIHESVQAIAWTHSDAPCGGPSTADPLILQP
ncbi:hypothetical protein [Microbacterium sp. NPDC091662]|uniref:hypothetical protein n=1 Tax=Microbacterium sp. NPDC091662 TaxID=3364211 RepID=UPI003801DD09